MRKETRTRKEAKMRGKDSGQMSFFAVEGSFRAVERKTRRWEFLEAYG
jgi:hypothetical protein